MGEITITECPLNLLDADVMQIMKMAEFYRKGLPPIAGGVLDQAKNFNDACDVIWREERYWKNRLGIIDG